MKLTGVGMAALIALALPAGASGAKVSATSAGGALADATGYYTQGQPLTQPFRLAGKKVKKARVTDVNLTLNSTGSAGSANLSVRAKLIAPGGDNYSIREFAGGGGQSLASFKLDDQSQLQLCNPLAYQASDCNYLQGATPSGGGVATGSVYAPLNLVFRSVNPKGTWRLMWWDTSQDGITRQIGPAVLEVSTARKAKR